MLENYRYSGGEYPARPTIIHRAKISCGGPKAFAFTSISGPEFTCRSGDRDLCGAQRVSCERDDRRLCLPVACACSRKYLGISGSVDSLGRGDTLPQFLFFPAVWHA